jgi:Flp pilus assembly protein TadG
MRFLFPVNPPEIRIHPGLCKRFEGSPVLKNGSLKGFTAKARRRGATLVEFVLVAPLFFALTLGIFEMARGLMVEQLVTDAARIGCRVGMVENRSTQAITTAVDGFLPGAGITGYTTTVQVNEAVTDAVNAQAGDEITVTVSVPTNKISWVPGLLMLQGTISGQFTLRRD